MRRRKFTFALGQLAALAAALSLGGATSAGAQSQAGGRDKVSADLRQKLSGSGKVNVVIRAAGSWGSTLDTAVKGKGGVITKSYASFPLRAVTLPAAAVGALAARADVGHISLDRPVKRLGHISLTTGADAARVLANYSPVYDGAGVGVAALDWVKTNRAAYNIRVINLSLGTAALDSYTSDPLCLAAADGRGPRAADDARGLDVRLVAGRRPRPHLRDRWEPRHEVPEGLRPRRPLERRDSGERRRAPERRVAQGARALIHGDKRRHDEHDEET